jgi:hypothetical protein
MLQENLTAQSSVQEQLVGAWKLVVFQRWLSGREFIYPWGTQIDGRLIRWQIDLHCRWFSLGATDEA